MGSRNHFYAPSLSGGGVNICPFPSVRSSVRKSEIFSDKDGKVSASVSYGHISSFYPIIFSFFKPLRKSTFLYNNRLELLKVDRIYDTQ